ncbi:MAG: heparinase II/III family protein [Pseudomonadota bacterium]
MGFAERLGLGLGLRRRTPVRFQATVADPLPGDPDRGADILRGDIVHGRHRFTLRGGDWMMIGADAGLAGHVHGFAWLRDLAAVRTPETGTDFLRPIVDGWLAHHAEPAQPAREPAWRSDRIGARLVFWALHAPFLLADGDAGRRARILGHYVRAARHGERHYARTPPGLPRITAAAGLVMAELMLDGAPRRLARAEQRLTGAIADFVPPHGLPLSRLPDDLVTLLDQLHILRAGYEAREKDWPDAYRTDDARIRAGLKAAQLGDGRLTAIHGGTHPADPFTGVRADWPGAAARGLGAGMDSGLQRLAAGKAVILMDAGPPPDGDVNDAAHAGALAFELSDGPQSLVVNVGGGGRDARLAPRLAEIVRTTAAHSTVIVADTNQSEIIAGAPLGRGIDAVEVSRQESEEGQWLDASHDGYRGRFGLIHRRRLFLAANGCDLRGEDILEPSGRRGSKARAFAVRFHLAPDIDAALTADGAGAVLRAPEGRVWRLKLSGAGIALDDSLVLDDAGRIQKTTQIVAEGHTEKTGARVRWRFTKINEDKT